MTMFVTDPNWAMGLLSVFALAGFATSARSAIVDWQMRRHAPRDPRAIALYEELEQLAEVWRGRRLASDKHAVALVFPIDKLPVVVRMDFNALDYDAKVVTAERLILTPFRPIVLRKIQGGRFELDENNRVVLLPEHGARREGTALRAVSWMLRTGMGVLTAGEMQELVEQVRAAQPVER
ncbi:hypothetical protein C8D87_11441 [Lentzea atacamensis]|uniref:Uncharacterized protein n=1 Tax=Lentzea atacamensis TaxID=531938 RepID=A0ABX9DVW8_9PSEU|nr:hypothetical protein C8D87_11441 [Lentzea atacamensis]